MSTSEFQGAGGKALTNPTSGVIPKNGFIKTDQNGDESHVIFSLDYKCDFV